MGTYNGHCGICTGLISSSIQKACRKCITVIKAWKHYWNKTLFKSGHWPLWICLFLVTLNHYWNLKTDYRKAAGGWDLLGQIWIVLCKYSNSRPGTGDIKTSMSRWFIAGSESRQFSEKTSMHSVIVNFLFLELQWSSSPVLKKKNSVKFFTANSRSVAHCFLSLTLLTLFCRVISSLPLTLRLMLTKNVT